MKMIVAGALAWEPGIGLVIDLSQLGYKGGDRLFYWKTVLSRFGLNRGNWKIALVWSEPSKVHIESLLYDEGDDELLGAAYDSVADAIAYVGSQRRGRQV